MNDKEFIQKYEELLNSGYCECNELNCLDNNSPRKILTIMKEQQKENNNLKTSLDEAQEVFADYKRENERLNNIINELEKYIKENSIYYNTSDGCQWVDQFKVLDKLKELKGSDNND